MKQWWFWVIIGVAVIVLLLVIGLAASGGGQKAATGRSSAPTAETPDLPTGDLTTDDPESEDPGPAEGEPGSSREDPLPLGSEVVAGDWTVVVNSVVLDATDEVLAENMFNGRPADGYQYALANITATYNGPDSVFPFADISLAYITVDGVKVDEGWLVCPEPFDSLAELPSGGSVSGNVGFEIPIATAADGAFELEIGFLDPAAFFFAAT
ncbi:MAG: DUF4352 domain-containing protein [Bifidobacteriaceae bacterium]|nr:DUF4352 domain-containing protein [Bifidobacteriaceae bacterium]